MFEAKCRCWLLLVLSLLDVEVVEDEQSLSLGIVKSKQREAGERRIEMIRNSRKGAAEKRWRRAASQE